MTPTTAGHAAVRPAAPRPGALAELVDNGGMTPVLGASGGELSGREEPEVL